MGNLPWPRRDGESVPKPAYASTGIDVAPYHEECERTDGGARNPPPGKISRAAMGESPARHEDCDAGASEKPALERKTLPPPSQMLRVWMAVRWPIPKSDARSTRKPQDPQENPYRRHRQSPHKHCRRSCPTPQRHTSPAHTARFQSSAYV